MAWSVDRLGRSLQDLVGFLSELHALKIDLFLRQQGLPQPTPRCLRWSGCPPLGVPVRSLVFFGLLLAVSWIRVGHQSKYINVLNGICRSDTAANHSRSAR